MVALRILNNFSLYILFEIIVANPNPKIIEKIYGAYGLYINRPNIHIYYYQFFYLVLFNRRLNRILNNFR